MHLQIKITNKQSIYLEIADKIESFIRLGVFKENEKLPSCRKLGMESLMLIQTQLNEPTHY